MLEGGPAQEEIVAESSGFSSMLLMPPLPSSYAAQLTERDRRISRKVGAKEHLY